MAASSIPPDPKHQHLLNELEREARSSIQAGITLLVALAVVVGLILVTLFVVFR